MIRTLWQTAREIPSGKRFRFIAAALIGVAIVNVMIWWES